jgi:hypothetical protein
MKYIQPTVNARQQSAKRSTGVVLAGNEDYYLDAQDRRTVGTPVAHQPRINVNPYPMRQEPAPLLTGVHPASTTIVQSNDDELTRAKATVVFTLPLSVALGVVVTAAVMTLSGTPFLSAVTLITFFGVFALTWGGAVGFFVARSPSGTAFMHTKRLWNVIENEQTHRHEVEWYLLEREERDNEQYQR